MALLLFAVKKRTDGGEQRINIWFGPTRRVSAQEGAIMQPGSSASHHVLEAPGADGR